MLAFRRKPHTTTEDERIGCIAFIIQDGSVYSWDADLVTIILHTCNNTRLNATGM